MILNLTDKIDLRRDEKSVALSNLCMEKHFFKIFFEISAPIWNDQFELPDGSYLISDIQDYFEYILKEHGENIDNPSIIIYINKI